MVSAPARPTFGVLGPLEAWVGDRSVTLGGPKRRALLAMLLLNANRTVSVEQLIGALWGGDPVESATVQVQSHVSALRRLLPGGRIVTLSPGYVLRLDTGDLDLAVFEERLSEARQALRAGEIEAAAAGFRSALELWRGDAVSDVLVPRVRLLARRLDDLRLTVLEERIDADLGLGRHRELEGELADLIVRYPFRERLRAQMMLALYRSGRRVKALDVARETRRIFTEDQGLDPSHALQELEHAILVGDPSLDLEPPTRAAPAPVIPRQLPAGIADFTGREAELRLLRDRLLGARSGSVAVVVVAGPGGVGKSTLAIHAAHEVAGDFPDGQLYASLRCAQSRPTEPGEVLAGFLQALGMESRAIPEGADARAALFRTMLAGRRVLVVLDGAAGSSQVRPLLPGSPSCAVLVTSRAALGDLEGSRCLELSLLDPCEALSLFGGIAGAERVEAEPEAAQEVVAACGYLPLAIRIAASRLATRAGWTVRVLADLLRDSRSRLDALRYGELGVRASFEVSYQALDVVSARAFRLLGLLDVPEVGLGMAAALLDVRLADAEETLELLVDARLLDSPAHGRYRYHDLVRLFARELAHEEPPERLTAAVDRSIRFALSSIERADLLVRPGRLVPYTDPHRGPVELPEFGYCEAVAWLETEHTGLLALALQAAALPAQPAALTARLVAHLSGFLEVRGLWEEWEQVARAALRAAERDGDRHAEALALHELALLAIRRNQPDAALAGYERCLELYCDCGDPLGETRARNSLGTLDMERGRLDEAASWYEAALELCQTHGIRRGECGILSNLGILAQTRGRLEEALAFYRESLVIQRETANRDGEANTLNNMGRCLREQGCYPEAISCHEQAIVICRESGNRYWEADTLVELAQTLREAGQSPLAVASAEAGLAISRVIGDQLGQANALRTLASVGPPPPR
jgi:DNA-binding SARP family transcriptional activator/tetratricopeptide (TPR) repeat protein